MIEIKYKAICDICEIAQQLSGNLPKIRIDVMTLREFMKRLEKIGWRRTQDGKNVCPLCVKSAMILKKGNP